LRLRPTSHVLASLPSSARADPRLDEVTAHHTLFAMAGLDPASCARLIRSHSRVPPDQRGKIAGSSPAMTGTFSLAKRSNPQRAITPSLATDAVARNNSRRNPSESQHQQAADIAITRRLCQASCLSSGQSGAAYPRPDSGHQPNRGDPAVEPGLSVPR
jgi:hypothetical protein